MSSYNVFAPYYDLFTKNVNYSLRARLYDELLLTAGAKKGILLDLACGTGSMSIEMAKKGYVVIGTDASENMLSIAQKKSEEQGLDILFLHQRMQELDLFGTVDACICVLDGLNHLVKKADLLTTLRKVSLFLSPGGIFAFDVNTVYKHQKVLANNCFVFEEKQCFCVWRNRTKGCKTQVALDLFCKTGKNSYRRESEAFTQRAYAIKTICSALRACGFSLFALRDGDSFASINPTSQRIVIAAKNIAKSIKACPYSLDK